MPQLKTQPRSKATKAAKPATGTTMNKRKADSPKKAAASKPAVKKTPTKPTAAKKVPAAKAPGKKSSTGKTHSKATPAKQTTAKQAPPKKTAAKKSGPAKPHANVAPTKKASVKKPTAKKAPVKKAPEHKTIAKKASGTKAPVEKATEKGIHDKKVAEKKASPQKVSIDAVKKASVNEAPRVGTSPKGDAVPARPAKVAKKQQYNLEFYLNASVASLYEHITTPSGFSKWFCDDVNVIDSMYTFQWGHDTEVAECLNQRPGEFIRFRWADDTDEDPNAYFELRIRIDGMTNETCLVVTDHAWPRDLAEEKALWEAQINTLMRVLGA